MQKLGFNDFAQCLQRTASLLSKGIRSLNVSGLLQQGQVRVAKLFSMIQTE
ncbi:hypothetical protein [Pseudoalteromonas luteoviolacea]|uniref:hypothetical protein n=1 Tax=Pseudoalteromonas luteoviolacea TaxID=43657 RepID=UPI00159F07CC|nr:hypothetical protein [Pseudoalteromonas luteoviolacea]